MDTGVAMVIAAIVAAVATVVVSMRQSAAVVRRAAVEANAETQKQLAVIEIKVDGRLEAALQKIDALQADIADLTGKVAPPPVAGQSGVN